LVPGGPGASHTYLWPHFSNLTKEFQVVYFDAYGRGKSDRASNPGEYTFDRDVDEVEALRQALGLGKIMLYGHSYGGMVAQAYALKYPQSLSQLVLADTFHSAEMWQKGNNDTLNAQLANQMPELWDRLLAIRKSGRMSCDPEYQKIEGEMPIAMSYFYDPNNANHAGYGTIDINLDVYCQMAGSDADMVLGGDLASLDFCPRLKEITAPTLILTGRFDRVAIPRFAVQFNELMPQATFVMFERSGHMPAAEEPGRHAEVLTAFAKQSNR
jgi:proline iminopeptidase